MDRAWLSSSDLLCRGAEVLVSLVVSVSLATSLSPSGSFLHGPVAAAERS